MEASASPFPTAADLDAVAVITLGGHAAQAVILGAPSASAEGDLTAATELVSSAHASAGLAGASIP
jgi:hypothetical protein